jgi:GntR family transcriptional regulator
MTTAYRAVKQKIVDALREEKWRHGQAIPSETALARRFGVSVGTVRHAVSELTAEHILVRQQGRGTFVVSHTRDYMLNVFFQIVDREGRKELPRAELLHFRRGRAEPAVAKALDLAADETVFRIHILQRLRGAPVIVDHLRLPARLFADLNAEVFANRDTTIYGLLQARYGVSVVRTEEHIEAARADERTARLMRIARCAPLLKIHRTGFAYRNLPVETRVRYVNTAQHRYLSQLGGR